MMLFDRDSQAGLEEEGFWGLTRGCLKAIAVSTLIRQQCVGQPWLKFNVHIVMRVLN
jgi:hypothetical protein